MGLSNVLLPDRFKLKLSFFIVVAASTSGWIDGTVGVRHHQGDELLPSTTHPTNGSRIGRK